jgi:penicillin-binding protein 1A
VAIDPRTGEIKAMVGGANFGKSQFNRAVQMKRQPGSSFKPFIYTAALEDGISPGTVLSDRPKTYEVFRNKWNPFGKWSPKNFNKKFSGAVTMRDALERSLNLPSIDLLEKVGISKAIDTSRKMGITSDLTPGLALALGVCEVSPLEITSAMGTLPSGGVRREPFAIKKIENSDGSLVYEHEKKEIRVLEENIAYLMIDIMKGVLSRGTGYKGRLSRPAAAKTGTSQDFKDAWTIGFTPQLICGVWVGNDDNKPMQGVAEVSVCPRIFKAFMESALQNEPPLDFPHPTGMVDARICLSSGMLANPYCPRNLVVAGSFFKGKEPISECYIHPIAKDDENKDEDNQDQDPAAPETSNDTNTNNEEPAQ